MSAAEFVMEQGYVRVACEDIQREAVTGGSLWKHYLQGDLIDAVAVSKHPSIRNDLMSGLITFSNQHHAEPIVQAVFEQAGPKCLAQWLTLVCKSNSRKPQQATELFNRVIMDHVQATGSPYEETRRLKSSAFEDFDTEGRPTISSHWLIMATKKARLNWDAVIPENQDRRQFVREVLSGPAMQVADIWSVDRQKVLWELCNQLGMQVKESWVVDLLAHRFYREAAGESSAVAVEALRGVYGMERSQMCVLLDKVSADRAIEPYAEAAKVLQETLAARDSISAILNKTTTAKP